MSAFLAHTPQELESPAHWLANQLVPGDLVLIYGEMGLGKTTFVAALAKALGSSDAISSPTYSILNEYLCTKGYLWHADLYRIRQEEEAMDAGFFEYVHRTDGVLCVEWPQNAPSLAYETPFFKVQFSKESNQVRNISIDRVLNYE